MICPKCGGNNRQDARFCGGCGEMFPQFVQTQPLASAPLPRDDERSMNDNNIVIRNYRVTATWKTASYTYHETRDDMAYRQCWNCGSTANQSTSKFCHNCGGNLYEPRYLIRETAQPLSAATEELLQRELRHPYIGTYREQFTFEQLDYIVYRLPEGARWAELKTSQPVTQVLRWGMQLAETLAYLHEQGLGRFDLETLFLDDYLIVGDPAACHFFTTDDYHNILARDLFFAGKVLYRLATGKNLAKEAEADAVSPRLQRVLRKMMGADYPSFQEVAAELRAALQLQPVHLATGSMSDAGKRRDHNEDRLHTQTFDIAGETVGLFIVADGMGGHDAGEVASQMTIDTICKLISQGQLAELVQAGVSWQFQQLLQNAVHAANRAVHDAARARHNNMGTTVTAALTVGQTAYIANVGDSRTYLLRDGELKPLTIDHSLVASLIAVGSLKPEEIYTHPQRNQIYRTIGDKAEVAVDIFVKQLEPHDMLLLCSDGLWEMVRDAQITAIMQRAPAPQPACAELVRAANAQGGEDNISVIIVQIR